MKNKRYLFHKEVITFKNSQYKIKETRFWSNEGRGDTCFSYLGAYVSYKDGTKALELCTKLLDKKELDYLSKETK